MSKIIFGNHSALRVDRTERDRIRKFYSDVLGLYFQAPGGQVFRLVGINEDLSIYEGK